jgi:glycosyltransferase involved in cell wall biosynthesis
LMMKFPHDIYHCVSLYTLNSLRIKWWISDKKLHLVYNGVDNDFWDMKKVKKSEIDEWKNKYWWNDSYLISYYGHAWKTKWIDLLVEAIPQILKENPDSKILFNIIPSKRSDNIVERINFLSKRLKAEDRIQIFRWFSKENLRIFVACADVIIAPSLAEWFGSVHSEACAMWKNLITSNLAAIPEVVSGNVILMSPPSEKWICESIQKIRNWNFDRIPERKFSWDEMIGKIENLYKF